MNTKRLAINGMLSAMCALLGYMALDMGNIKITFESMPVLLGALMLGPTDGLIIGGIGTLVYQLLRYGITLTTPLWILPYMMSGLLVGLYAKQKSFHLTSRQIVVVVALNELMITILNTGVIYIDSKIYGYYSAAYVLGSLGIRLIICFARAAIFSIIIPKTIEALSKTHI